MAEGHQRMAASLGGLVVVGGVAFGVGRLSVSTPEPREVVRYVEKTGSGATPRDAAPPPGGSTGHAGHVEPTPGSPTAETEIPAAGKPVDFGEVFRTARAARAAGPEDHHTIEAAQAAAGELERRLLSDPAALAAALQRFPTLRDAAELEVLAAVLGRVRDPEVEELAMRMARDTSNLPRRAAAFDLLDALDTPQARQLSLDTLASERDPEVRRAALRAIPDPEGASQRDAGGVVASLGQILQTDPDPELRRRAAVMLGSWHRDLSELTPLLSHLAGDTDVNVRAGCAFGLELSGRRDAAVLDALVRSVSAKGEDPLVRHNSHKALAALSPLPDAAHQAYEAYQAELDAASEASGN
jgi:hypothetical protein